MVVHPVDHVDHTPALFLFEDLARDLVGLVDHFSVAAVYVWFPFFAAVAGADLLLDLGHGRG